MNRREKQRARKAKRTMARKLARLNNTAPDIAPQVETALAQAAKVAAEKFAAARLAMFGDDRAVRFLQRDYERENARGRLLALRARERVLFETDDVHTLADGTEVQGPEGEYVPVYLREYIGLARNDVRGLIGVTSTASTRVPFRHEPMAVAS